MTESSIVEKPFNEVVEGGRFAFQTLIILD